ncbi:MAG: type II toxin-antitoxin system VapC family toxin [Thermoleophilia bacterium]
MYVDTSVFMYAFGSPSPFKESCAAVLDAGAAGRLSLVTSVETLQEILHRYRSLRRTDDLRIVFDAVLASTRSVLPIVLEDMQEARELGEGLPPDSGVSARDLLHAAVARRHGLSQVLSTDRGFDAVPGLVRVDPRGLDGAAHGHEATSL